jgi:hypothetical protein
VDDIKAYIKQKATTAEVEFSPWGSARLLHAVRSTPAKTLTLDKVKDFSTTDQSVVCLAQVDKFAAFLTDESGNMRTWLLEPNVRDYQGRNQVNKQIRATLLEPIGTEEFWWLNNGVTILSDGCSVMGDKVVITNPEIVNGLQTSHEIFNSFSDKKRTKDERCVLVKVIVAPNDRVKNAIVKATNSQTPVSLLSLKATEPLQFDIEDRLLLLNLFYDRKKGKYKRLKKPIKDIVSMKAMGQAIIAAFLQRPSDSRARPETLLKEEKVSPTIFNDNYEQDFYASCILLDRQCARFLCDQKLNADEEVDVRYYVTMLAMCEVTGQSSPSALDISKALPAVSVPIKKTALTRCLKKVREVYNKLGATDKVAKGKDMQVKLLKYAKSKFRAA